MEVYKIPTCRYYGETQPLEITEKQLDQFIYAMLRIDSFGDDGIYDINDHDFNIDLIFNNIDIEMDGDEFGYMTVSKKCGKRNKSVILTDWPGVITSIFGFDYEKFIPAAFENMALVINCIFDVSYQTYTAKVSNFRIDKVEMCWQQHIPGRAYVFDITESLSERVMDLLAEYCEQSAESDDLENRLP